MDTSFPTAHYPEWLHSGELQTWEDTTQRLTDRTQLPVREVDPLPFSAFFGIARLKPLALFTHLTVSTLHLVTDRQGLEQFFDHTFPHCGVGFRSICTGLGIVWSILTAALTTLHRVICGVGSPIYFISLHLFAPSNHLLEHFLQLATDGQSLALLFSHTFPNCGVGFRFICTGLGSVWLFFIGPLRTFHRQFCGVGSLSLFTGLHLITTFDYLPARTFPLVTAIQRLNLTFGHTLPNCGVGLRYICIDLGGVWLFLIAATYILHSLNSGVGSLKIFTGLAFCVRSDLSIWRHFHAVPDKQNTDQTTSHTFPNCGVGFRFVCTGLGRVWLLGARSCLGILVLFSAIAFSNAFSERTLKQFCGVGSPHPFSGPLRHFDFDFTWHLTVLENGTGTRASDTGLAFGNQQLSPSRLAQHQISFQLWTVLIPFFLSGCRILLQSSLWFYRELNWLSFGRHVFWRLTICAPWFGHTDPTGLPITVAICLRYIVFQPLLACWALVAGLISYIYTKIYCTTCILWFFRLTISQPALECLNTRPPLRPSRRGGNPGPKSRGRKHRAFYGSTRIFHPFLGVFILLQLQSMIQTARGEGCAPVMGSAEASTDWQQGLIDRMDAKQHDMRPETYQTLTWFPNMASVKKRSLKRAYARACHTGLAWYRGRCYTPSDFPSDMKPPSMKQTSNMRMDDHSQYLDCNRRHQDPRRFRILNWNTGGLPASKLDEVKIWLESQRIDAAILTETRMTFESEWSDAHWHHIHTGLASDRGAGILCIISKRLCSAQQIRWRSVILGRLLHVQIQGKHRSFDLVGCYQHTQGHTTKRRSERQHWWTQLDAFLHELAHRNILFLAGDFNTSLPQSPAHAGPSHFRWRGAMTPGAQHEDQGQFMATLRMHGLVALNTWHPEAGPTFHSPTACSRIDFMITRKNTADGCAKQIRHVWDAPFCSSFGHVPMVGLIRKYWIPPASESQVQTLNPGQRRRGLLAFHEQTDLWHQLLQETGAQALQRLTTATPSDETVIPDLHLIACEQFQTFFPRQSCNKPEDSNAHAIVMNKWDHRRALQRICSGGLQNLFHAWHHMARFQHLKRQARQHAQHVRQLRFAEVTESAAAAAARHDTHSLFNIINRFTPKQPKRRMQLRNPSGQIATPVEETAMLRHFIQETWRGPSHFPVPAEPLAGLPFTQEELEQALRAIPAIKAVARPCAPGTVWKSLASILTPALYSLLETWWVGDNPFIPHWFKAGWMLLIPKPNKPPVHPSALRPLALQEPLGKALVGLLAAKAQDAVLPQLVTWPIWAYMPRRSTQDALLRVVLHCKAVRDLLAGQRPTPFSRAQNTHHLRVAGGIGVFLDIERAFDFVNRPQLFAKLTEVGVPMPIACLLTHWHQDTGYYLQSQGEESHIPVGRGLRQGCKAAPMLWNIYLLLFLTELSKHVDRRWICTCVNFYADDGQLGNSFRTAAELQNLLQNIGTTLTVLQEFGMTINSNKCAALVAFRGTMARKLRSTIIVTKQGKEWLKLPGKNAEAFLIPVVTHVKYLGAVLTYQNLEDKTTHHRIQLSRIAFGRLGRWLKGRKGLPLWQRIRIWTTCVYPVLSYGLCTVGITHAGYQKLQQHMYSMLRQVIHDHAFFTQHSNPQALAKHGIDLPPVWLWRTADSLLQSATQRLHNMLPDDVEHGGLGGCGGPSLAGLQRPGPDAGQNAETEPERCTKAPKKRRTRYRAEGQPTERPGATGPGPTDADQAHHQIGSRAANPAEGGHLHILFRKQRERELLGHPSSGDGGLGRETEGNQGCRQPDENAAAAAASHASALHQLDEQSGTIGQRSSGFRDHPSGSGQQGGPPGHDLPLSGVVPHQEGFDCQQEETTQHEETPSDLHGYPGSSDMPQHGGEVSLASLRSTTGSLPMEATGECSPGPALATPCGAMWIGHLAVDGNHTQDPQPGTKSTCLQPAEGHESAGTQQEQGQGEGQTIPGGEDGVTLEHPALPLDPKRMLQRLAHLTMENPGNLCFANSATLAMLWTTLSTHTWQLSYWGEQCLALQSLLAEDQTLSTNLGDTEWFQQIVRCWGDRDPLFDPVNISQQDAAEHVAIWFSLMRSSAFDMQWEKRLEENEQVRVFDTSSQHSPICLKFDSLIAYTTTCDLTQLFRLWCQVDGMHTALTQSPPCLCIQIERRITDEMNNLFRSECMIQTEEPCLVPVFVDQSLQYELVEYHVVALVAHIGADQAGHIRAALRLAPSIVDTIKPAHWLITEDWKRPEPIWEIPSWMKRHGIMYWLIRADCLQLWRYRPLAIDTELAG